MNRPKFCVGEEVAVVSKNFPYLNIDRTEVTVAIYGEARLASTGEVLTGYKYKTASRMGPRFWHESALRKLPPKKRTSWKDCVFKPDSVVACL